MPKNVLPEAARVLPKAGQSVWMKAFNQALDEGQSETEASKIAWAAVKRAGYSKNSNGKWGKSMDTDFVLNEEDDTFVFGAPIMKIDVQKRIVEGFATLNNVDQAGDLVDLDASVEAFSDWFGNIREMHQKIAVGKAIDWKTDVYTDPETGEEYNGIWVRAKISKGAEDTWQKVLDGTLSGFSIGGATLEKQRDILKTAEGVKNIWRITKYKLTELSLVDNPCNRLAKITLIKSADGEDVEVDDTVADGEIEKAYNGETGEFVDLTPAMKGVISAVEAWRDEAIANNADSVVARASEMLCDLRSSCRWEAEDAKYHAEKAEKSDDKGVNMKKNDETLHENANSDITNVELTEQEKSLFRKFIDFVTGNPETPAEDVESGGAENNEEGETPEMTNEDVTKAVDEAIEAVKEEITKSADEKLGQIGESLVKITEALEKVATAEAVETVKTELKSELDALVERVEALENGGAVKKSGEDAGNSGEKIEKSDEGFWSGSLLPEYLVK